MLDEPGLGAVGIGCDVGGRLDRIGAEQFSRSSEQSPHLVELLLQRRISHNPTLPRPRLTHNSPPAHRLRGPDDAGTLTRWRSSVDGVRASDSESDPGILTIPTFSSSLDCTTRVIGGLWPAELSSNTAETATLAEHLKADLHRIVGSANDELMVIWRAGMADSTRRAEEDRVIDRAASFGR